MLYKVSKPECHLYLYFVMRMLLRPALSCPATVRDTIYCIYIHCMNAHQHVYSTCLLYASIFNPADQVMENADGFISNWAHRNPRLLLCLLRAIEMPQAICELRKYHTRCSRPCIFFHYKMKALLVEKRFFIISACDACFKIVHALFICFAISRAQYF